MYDFNNIALQMMVILGHCTVLIRACALRSYYGELVANL